MAISWREAKECSARGGLPQVCHDCDADVLGHADLENLKGGLERVSL
jgi:hypothetical protein